MEHQILHTDFKFANTPPQKDSFFPAKEKATTPFFSPKIIQTKLTIGEPGDKYEQEADAMADHVVNMSKDTNTPAPIQTKCAGCEEEAQRQPLIQKMGGEEELDMKPQIQRMESHDMYEEKEKLQTKPQLVSLKGNFSGSEASPELEQQLGSSKSGGSPLSESTLGEMNSAFGADFSSVRVHNDSSAVQMNQQLGAQAFTHGNNVYFNQGKYDPSSSAGKQLLAHELTHTIQQGAVEQELIQKKKIQKAPDVIEVEIVEDAPRKAGTVKDIVLDTVNTIQGCLENFRTALFIFSEVVKASSKEEAAPKSTGLIVFEQIRDTVAKKLFGQITSALPGGKIAVEVVDLMKGMTAAIDAEKKRSAKASEENALKDFITILHKTIGDSISSILSEKQDEAVRIQKEYDGLKDAEKKERYRRSLERDNDFFTKAQKLNYSSKQFFTTISERWTKNSLDSGGKRPARLIIKLDRSWSVISAYLDAPRGSRIAEQLLRLSGNSFSIHSFDVPAFVGYYPEYPKDGWGLVECSVTRKDGKYHNLRYNYLARPFVKEFREKLSTKPIPKVSKMNGRRTSK